MNIKITMKDGTIKKFLHEGRPGGSYSKRIMCVACVNRRADCFHHVKTRGAGGSDEKWNLMPVCIAHHNAIHMKGTSWMAFTFQGVNRWLQKHGWVNDNFRKKWLPPNGAWE